MKNGGSATTKPSGTVPAVPSLSKSKSSGKELTDGGPLTWFCGAQSRQAADRWSDVSAACSGTCAKAGCIQDARAPVEAQPCIVLCGLQKVIVQRKVEPQMFGWLLGHKSQLFVEILPTGHEAEKERTDSAHQLKAAEKNNPKNEETWVWKDESGGSSSSRSKGAVPQANGLYGFTTHSAHELVFNVKMDTELTLRVLGSQSTADQIELLGIARFHPDEDIIPAVGVHGSMTLPLVKDGRVRGSVTIVATVHCKGGPPLSSHWKTSAGHSDSVPFGEDEAHSSPRPASRRTAGSDSPPSPLRPASPATGPSSLQARALSHVSAFSAASEASTAPTAGTRPAKPTGGASLNLIGPGGAGLGGLGASGMGPAAAQGFGPASKDRPPGSPDGVAPVAASGSLDLGLGLSSSGALGPAGHAVATALAIGAPAPTSGLSTAQPTPKHSPRQEKPSLSPGQPAQQRSGEVRLEGHSQAVACCAAFPQGDRVLTGSDDGTAIIWSVPRASATGQPLKHLRGHIGKVTACAVFPDGSKVLTESEDHGARLWSADTGEQLVTLVGASRCQLFPGGDRILAAVGDHGSIFSSNGENVAVLRGHADVITACAVFPAGDKVLTVSKDEDAIVWSHVGSTLRVLRGHKGAVSACAIFQSGERAVTVSEDTTAIIWSTAGAGKEFGKQLCELRGHTAAIRACAVLANDESLVTVSDDARGILWSITGSRIADFKGHTDAITSCALLPSVDAIMTASVDGTGAVWSSGLFAAGRKLCDLKGHTARVNGCAVLSDSQGDRMVTVSDDKVAIVWPVDVGHRG